MTLLTVQAMIEQGNYFKFPKPFFSVLRVNDKIRLKINLKLKSKDQRINKRNELHLEIPPPPLRLGIDLTPKIFGGILKCKLPVLSLLD